MDETPKQQSLNFKFTKTILESTRDYFEEAGNRSKEELDDLYYLYCSLFEASRYLIEQYNAASDVEKEAVLKELTESLTTLNIRPKGSINKKDLDNAMFTNMFYSKKKVEA